MDNKIKYPYQFAKSIADKALEEFRPYCERIEIAGSLRRQKREIGDIEICAIPRYEINLFGEPGLSLLNLYLGQMAQKQRLVTEGKWGPSYKKFRLAAHQEMSIDLFITSPPQWGLIFMIRTGSAEFSQRLVTQKNKGGLLPSHLKVSDGWVWDGNERLELPEEDSVFALLGIDYINPQDR